MAETAQTRKPLWYEIIAQGIAGPPPRWSYGPSGSWDFEPDELYPPWRERQRVMLQRAERRPGPGEGLPRR